MKELAAQQWQSVLDKLSAKVSQQSFDTWFARERVEVLRFDSERLELGVANRFIREWLRDHYLPLIREAITDVSGATPEINLVVSGKPFRQMRSKQKEEITPSPRPAPRAGTTLALNREFRLDEFVVGASNRLAHAACVSVVESPAVVYNPLFVYGGTGLGKTHLLQAVCQAFHARRQDARIAYVSCEEFANGYITAIQTRSIDEFRARYRQLDLLAVDDVHFLGAKQKTQDEFHYTFDALQNLGKQVVLSSDSHAKEIAALKGKLVTRFVSGLVARVSPPDFETRVAILRHKAAKRGLVLPEPMLEEIARHVTANVRELEGALGKLRALSATDGREIDEPLVRYALRELATSRHGPVTLEEIVRAVESEFSVSVADLRSRKRTRKVLRPRQLAMFVARHSTDHSLAEIGNYLGGRDHATVVHSEKRVRAELGSDSAFRRAVDNVFRSLGRPAPQL